MSRDNFGMHLLFGNDLLMTFIPFLSVTHLENSFPYMNNLHHIIKFAVGKESNGELEFLDTSLKQLARKMLYPPRLINHIPLPPLKMT